jgi:Flp pilus assembly protein TadG
MRRCRSRDDRGAAAVEFALVVIPLSMLVFGLLEFGIAFAQNLSLSNAARQGARYAAVPNSNSVLTTTTTCANILSVVQNGADTLGMKGSDVRVKITSPSTGESCTTSNPNGALLASDFSSTQSNQPCAQSTPTGNDPVRVDATFVGHLTIPLVFTNPTFTFKGTGVYQCEYSHG